MASEIVPKNKKPETFLDRLRTKLSEHAEEILSNFPEVDALSVGITYNAQLGDHVDPQSIIFARYTEDPLTRARIATTIAALVEYITVQTAEGFREAAALLQQLQKEIDGKRRELGETVKEQTTS